MVTVATKLERKKKYLENVGRKSEESSGLQTINLTEILSILAGFDER